MTLDATVKRNIVRALIGLCVFVLIAIVLGVLFETYIAAASERFR